MNTPNTPNAADRPSDEVVAAWRAARISSEGCAWERLGEVQRQSWRDEYIEKHTVSRARELDAQPHAATSAGDEAVAWMHDDPTRIDVIPSFVKALLERAHAQGSRRPLMTEHYTIPLYLHPQPSTPGAVSDEDVDALAKLIADAIGHGMREKCEAIARATLESFAKRGVVAKSPSEFRKANLHLDGGALALAYGASASPPAQAVSVPDGFVLVPKEATPEMLDAAGAAQDRGDWIGRHYFARAWPHMLAAAPAAPTSGDGNVEAVRGKLLDRSRRGIAKYGTTTERGDLSLQDWLVHMQEELLDAAVYVQAAIANTTAAATEGKCEVCDGTGMANVIDPDDGALVIGDCPNCPGDGSP